MQFCDSCGSLMIPGKEKGKLACSSCGGKSKASSLIKITERLKAAKSVEAVEQQVTGVMPKVKAECPKCGNTDAFFREEQTRSADEPATQFFTCTKCGKVWRDYE